MIALRLQVRSTLKKAACTPVVPSQRPLDKARDFIIREEGSGNRQSKKASSKSTESHESFTSLFICNLSLEKFVVETIWAVSGTSSYMNLPKYVPTAAPGGEAPKAPQGYFGWRSQLKSRLTPPTF